MQEFLEISTEKDGSKDHQYIMISQALFEIVDQKETQYIEKNVVFRYSFDLSLRSTFIYGNAIVFYRMVSNLINNAVDAFDGKHGTINIGFTTEDDKVKIIIQDNGKGMPQEIVEKLMRDEPIFSAKRSGYGLGTQQIRDALNDLSGKQFIESKHDVGTKITIIIPISHTTSLIIEQINLNKNDFVLILTDNIFVRRLLKNRLKQLLPDITLKFFENGQEALDFINSCGKKSDILLLSDNDLKNQALSGLEIIKKVDIANCKSILVSNIYNQREIQRQVIEFGIKILPKEFINSIPVIFEWEKYGNFSFEKTNVIVLDDKEYFANFISDILRSNGLVVDTYYDPRNLMNNISRYNVNTKIITDNCFDGIMTGDVLAKELLEKGFKNLCVLTGFINDNMYSKYPEGTTFITKGGDDNDDDILHWCMTGE